MSSPGSSLEKAAKKAAWILAGYRAKPSPHPEDKPLRDFSLLAIRPDRLGDFILSIPALRFLQSRLKSPSQLTLVAGERNEEIARFFFPEAKILVFRKNLLRRSALFLNLWFRRFDAVVDFHSYPFSTTSALLSLVSGSSRRVGFQAEGEWAEISRGVFNRGVRPPEENLHERDKSLRLAERLVPGRFRLSRNDFFLSPLPAGIREEVETFYRTMGLRKGERILGLHPSLQKADNRWSPNHYRRLIDRLGKNRNFKFVLVHGMGEEGEWKRFKRDLGSRPNVFSLPKADVLFILEAAKSFDLFVGGDSGLTHLAALVTPVISIFGPSDPRRWGPLDGGRGTPRVFRKGDLLCDSVTPEEVAGAVHKVLARRRPAGFQQKKY